MTKPAALVVLVASAVLLGCTPSQLPNRTGCHELITVEASYDAWNIRRAHGGYIAETEHRGPVFTNHPVTIHYGQATGCPDSVQ